MPHQWLPLLNATQILFVQVNLDQSDEVTSNQEHKFMNKCRKPEIQASLTVSCMMQREGVQYNPSAVLFVKVYHHLGALLLQALPDRALHMMSEQDTLDVPQAHQHGKSSTTTPHDC